MVSLPFPRCLSVVFRNPEGSVHCCPRDVQYGSKDIGAPGMTYMAASGEKSSGQVSTINLQGYIPLTSLLQFLSPSQLQGGAKVGL